MTTDTELWYTAVRKDGSKQIDAISGSYATKEEADAYVENPGSRDREIACLLDPWAHFHHYMTILVAKPVVTVLDRAKAVGRDLVKEVAA